MTIYVYIFFLDLYLNYIFVPVPFWKGVAEAV